MANINVSPQQYLDQVNNSQSQFIQGMGGEGDSGTWSPPGTFTMADLNKGGPNFPSPRNPDGTYTMSTGGGSDGGDFILPILSAAAGGLAGAGVGGAEAGSMFSAQIPGEFGFGPGLEATEGGLAGSAFNPGNPFGSLEGADAFASNAFNPPGMNPNAGIYGDANLGFGNSGNATGLNTGMNGGSFFDKLKSMWNSPLGQGARLGKSIFDVGNSIYGMQKANQMQRIARTAYDPVTALRNNPNSVTSQPGYQFGLDQGREAIRRQGAAGGSGGNEAIALARYTPQYAQDYYDKALSSAMTQAGGSGALNLAASNASARQASSSLATAGYGLATGLGADRNNNDIVSQWLRNAFSTNS